jgi:hypothetical protein
MRRGGAPAAFVLAGLALALSACGTGHSSPPTSPSSTTSLAPTTSSTPVAATTSSTSTSAPQTSSGPSNLVVTDQLRAELIAAGASFNNIPASEYSGLRPGLTYYAYDPATETYWAGAGLVGTTMQAQVSTQDEGAYMIFHRTGSGAWGVQAVGLDGGALGACPPQTPPPDIVALWGWSAGSCRPYGA